MDRRLDSTTSLNHRGIRHRDARPPHGVLALTIKSIRQRKNGCWQT
jgi:hypothetical protein